MDPNMKPVNINITQGNEESKKYETNNIYRDYIIQTNQQLNQENKTINIKIKELETQISSLEDENDKFDERIRYMKGLLSNLYEIKNYSLQVKDYQSELVNKYKNMCLRLSKIELSVSNFVGYYFRILWFIIIIDFIMSKLYLNYIANPYIKIIIFHTIPLIMMILIYKFFTNYEPISFINYKKKSTHRIYTDLESLSTYEKNHQSKINELLSEIKKSQDACLGIDVMIDNI